MSHWVKNNDKRTLTGRPWRRLVERIKLRDQYTCQLCGRVTADGDADHIVPLADAGADDMANLQWLCREPCHADKTIRDRGGKVTQPIGPDGWPVERST